MIGLRLNKDACDAVEEQSEVLKILLHMLHKTEAQVCSKVLTHSNAGTCKHFTACKHFVTDVFKDAMSAHSCTVYVTHF